MLVEDVIHLARYSELGSGAIKDNTPAIVSFINLGMIELYKRFALNRLEIVVPIEVGKTLYTLPDDFMYATSAFHTVEENGELKNKVVSINDEQKEKSVFFPSYNKVQIPSDLDTTEITIIYVNKPPKYTIENLQDTIALPEVLVESLLHYLGYKAHLGIRSDGQSENNSHYQRFERSVNKAKQLGVVSSTDYYRETNRIFIKGFV